MDCENYWPWQQARGPRTCRTGARIIWRRQTLAQAYWILWVLFIGLQIADVVTTNYALTNPGNWEANPIMQLSQAYLGAAWWLPKVAAIGFGAVAVPQALRLWGILLGVSYYMIVVSSNLALL
jgi:hypothetical protein